MDQNYRVFPEIGTGAAVNLMPQLVAEGMIPLSSSDIMETRLEALNSSEEVKQYWWGNSFDTGDAILYYPDESAKIILDAYPLRRLNPSTILSDGALILRELYESLDGEKFSQRQMKKYISYTWLKKKQVKNNPVWQILARDKQRLSDYADAVFCQIKEKHHVDTAMALYKGIHQAVPTMRLWYIGTLDDGSDAGCDSFLDDNDSRIVGKYAKVCALEEIMAVA